MKITRPIVPHFSSIPIPEIAALVVGSGSGSKLLQSLLDNHEQIYMIPGFPLLYFYPHWEAWKRTLHNHWNWSSIIDLFCEKHASVIDSRRIPGDEGLNNLGENRNEHIQIDENLFRFYLSRLLVDQPIQSKIFLLAIHYAYALCKNEDIKIKRILVYHIHHLDYLIKYLIKDFPDVKVITMLRDPRAAIPSRNKVIANGDRLKLNRSDAMIYRQRVYNHACEEIFHHMNRLNCIPPNHVRVVKHEDLCRNLEGVLEGICEYLGISLSPRMYSITMGGKCWWGAKIHDRPPTNKINPEILANTWRETLNFIDWFVLEGLMYHRLIKYGYSTYKYTSDSVWSRILLFFAILIPPLMERKALAGYFRIQTHREFLTTCFHESMYPTRLKEYSWNATYRHKWTYIDLKLWKSRWYRAFLYFAFSLSEQRPDWKIGAIIVFLSRMTYVFVNYVRFWCAILKIPLIMCRRIEIFYRCFFRNIRQKNYFPEPVRLVEMEMVAVTD